ncbi:multicopper oxidase [Colletotrichum graminicola M1.001]|uniref:Multicopper oxidase n=1 Tax=Colletotrichum graminicola (strain M1.001 / M2 / FGSC 10212) TaxID=645133 RepID=E3QKR1_COLGM|nr:multicopper oxidase [Colletotrichum graminicola M1.001]EFQ31449.1 multicopper oxidase [Colletotrichum graminicola M1.001]
MSVLRYLLPTLALALGAIAESRNFELDLTWQTASPDGFAREMILVNGQFTGPRIEVTEGDDVTIKVHNNLPYSTTVHYHGIEQLNTPWSDGVPGVTQRAIPPGGSFVYQWKATQYGAYWYHAHWESLIEDGLFGPITIHPAASHQKPFSLISSDGAAINAMEKAEKKVVPLVLSDHRHMISEEVTKYSSAANIQFSCYDSFLFNGKGKVTCRTPEEIDALLTQERKDVLANLAGARMTDKACIPAAIVARGQGDLSKVPPGVFEGCQPSDGGQETFKVEKSNCDTEKWVAFDIIGAYHLHTAMFSIDNHSMWVYAMDGAYVLPQEVEAIPVTNGDRYSVLVKYKQQGDFSIRAASVIATQMLSGTALLQWREKGQPEPQIVPSAPWVRDNGQPVSRDVRVFRQALAKPYPPISIPRNGDVLHKFNMHTSGGSYFWALNETVLLPADYENDNPVLFSLNTNENDPTIVSTKNGTWVDMVFQVVNSPQPPHPIHKHGNKMFLLGSGAGNFTWNSIEEAVAANSTGWNLNDPPRRDGFATPNAINGPTWMAVRYLVDNPGAWLLHCHIQSHIQGGMSAIIQDGINAWPVTPQEFVNYP